MTTQRYKFEIVINDSGDEFSDEFNLMDSDSVYEYEKFIEDVLKDSFIKVESVTLKEVCVKYE